MELQSQKPSDGIASLDFMHRSLLFAELASIAYQDITPATKLGKKLGFTQCELYDKDGAQAYRFQNAKDCVIVCRGTEPTQLNDIAADLKAAPVRSDTVSRVHQGFKDEVDELWTMVVDDLVKLKKQTLWFAGHSLGAAMATIMASRAQGDDNIIDATQLYTFGSPRVGWRGFVNTLTVEHHRWVNNNDIVTTVPPALLLYKHDGIMHYIDSEGDIDEEKGLVRVWDKLQGTVKGLMKGTIDQFSDHSMTNYIAGIAAKTV